MSIPFTDSKNSVSVFDIFENCLHQLNFAVAFRVNGGKCFVDAHSPHPLQKHHPLLNLRTVQASF